jgi:hypothetical protein
MKKRQRCCRKVSGGVLSEPDALNQSLLPPPLVETTASGRSTTFFSTRRRTERKPSYIGPGLSATGAAFDAGYALNRWMLRGNYWGGGINWNRNTINVNRPVVNPLANPAHRGRVRYNNVNVQQRFGNTNIVAGNRPRPDFRGSGGHQVLRPGGGAGNRVEACFRHLDAERPRRSFCPPT